MAVAGQGRVGRIASGPGWALDFLGSGARDPLLSRSGTLAGALRRAGSVSWAFRSLRSPEAVLPAIIDSFHPAGWRVTRQGRNARGGVANRAA